MKQTKTMQAGSVTLDVGPLTALTKDIRTNQNARVKVGILADHNARNVDAIGNADLGLIHEFGSVTKNIPERSFIRMPMISYLPEAIKTVGPAYWRKMIAEKGLLNGLRALGILAEDTIQGAFATGGYGLWAKLKRATIRRKGSSAILIDTAEMRQAITSRVVK